MQACCWHVARPPKPGETFQAHHLTVEPGGKGLNVAIGLHRLGLAVHTVLGCGQDSAGDALLSCLQTEGLDTSGVLRLPGPSGWGAGLLGADGQNAIAVYLGANLLLRPEHVRANAPQLLQSDLVYGQFETSLSAVAEAFELAHEQGITTVLNPSPWQTPPEAIVQSTHMMLVNETEAGELLELTGNAASPSWANWEHAKAQLTPAVDHLWSRWPALQCLIVTLGDLGASVWCRPSHNPASRTTTLYMKAPSIEAQDSVGAGDAFACGFLSHWVTCPKQQRFEPAHLAASLHKAQVLGAHMANTVGVLAGLVTAAQWTSLQNNLRPGPAQWQT